MLLAIRRAAWLADISSELKHGRSFAVRSDIDVETLDYSQRLGWLGGSVTRHQRMAIKGLPTLEPLGSMREA